MHVQPPMGEHAPFESIHPFLCLANSNGSIIIAPLWTPNAGSRLLTPSQTATLKGTLTKAASLSKSGLSLEETSMRCSAGSYEVSLL